MFCSFIVFLSLPHDRVQLFSFFDFGWELFVYPYSGSSELLGSSSSDEFPVFKVGEFSYDFPRVFVELVPFSHPVDSFEWNLIVESIFSIKKFLKKCLCVLTVMLGYSSEY